MFQGLTDLDSLRKLRRALQLIISNSSNYWIKVFLLSIALLEIMECFLDLFNLYKCLFSLNLYP